MHAGIRVTPPFSSFLSGGGSMSRMYIKYSVGTFWPKNEAAKGSFHATVTSLLLELLLWGSEVTWESLTYYIKELKYILEQLFRFI